MNLCFPDCFDGDHSFEDIGLAAGRSQREKKRSYKDFLREEEEVAAQVRSSSKKKSKVSPRCLSKPGSQKNGSKPSPRHLITRQFFSSLTTGQ